MRKGWILAALCASFAATVSAGSSPRVPLPSGEYVFTHRFDEQPDLPGGTLRVRIRGHRIEVFNDGADKVFPKGLISRGRLMWHADSQHWIIVETPEDRDAPEVGGCSGGPEVVDLDEHVYWSC